MKIDEGSINHNAVTLIDEIVSSCYDYIEKDSPRVSREIALRALGEIAGVIDMAKTLKKVLKA